MNNLIDIKVPDIGDSVKISKILKEKGSLVKKHDTIALCEGDSIELEIKSDFSGVIEEIVVKEGDVVSNNSVVAKLITSENSDNNKTVDDIPVAKKPPKKALNSTDNKSADDNVAMKDAVKKLSKKQKKKSDAEEVKKEETESSLKDNSENNHENNSDIDKNNFVKKEEIIGVIKSKDDDIEEVLATDNSCEKISYRIIPFLKNLLKFSKPEKVNTNVYDYYRYLDLSYISNSLKEFASDYKNSFGEEPKIDPFFVKIANIVLKKTEHFKPNRLNYIYKSQDKSILNYVDNISKRKYSDIQSIISKEGDIKNSDNILKIIYNYRNGFMKSNSPNCVVLNALDNDKEVIVSYSNFLKHDNGFYETFFRCLENPAWIMFDIMV